MPTPNVWRQCQVPGCSLQDRKKLTTLSWHKFPGRSLHRKLKEQWTNIIRRCKADPEWIPSDDAFICSRHFKDQDFFSSELNRRYIKPTSVPSLHLPEPRGEELDSMDVREGDAIPQATFGTKVTDTSLNCVFCCDSLKETPQFALNNDAELFKIMCQEFNLPFEMPSSSHYIGFPSCKECYADCVEVDQLLTQYKEIKTKMAAGFIKLKDKVTKSNQKMQDDPLRLPSDPVPSLNNINFNVPWNADLGSNCERFRQAFLEVSAVKSDSNCDKEALPIDVSVPMVLGLLGSRKHRPTMTIYQPGDAETWNAQTRQLQVKMADEKESENMEIERLAFEKQPKASLVYTCLECNEGFFGQPYLRAHSRLHSAKGPFSCLLCSPEVDHDSPDILLEHLATHTGFLYKNYTNNKPPSDTILFACEICQIIFTTQSLLSDHKRNKHKNKIL